MMFDEYIVLFIAFMKTLFTKRDQSGVVNPLLILALSVVGILIFIMISRMAPFKDSSLFGNLYDKPPVDAAGRGKGKPNTTTATLVPSCNPCAAGTVVHFSGSGYDASQGKAQLDVAGAVTLTMVYPDGTISFDWPYFSIPGSYTVKTYQQDRGGKLVLKAQTTVTVQ